MLKSWSIQNFKPIVNSGELKLAPVTVLAGRNSSGKSSLLQSILMIAQTLSSKVVDRPLLPNGLSVQLGTFEDVLNSRYSSHSLVVGFELSFIQPLPYDSPSEKGIRLSSAKIMAEFNRGSTNGKSSSAIEASRVIVDKVSLVINAEYRVFPPDDIDLDGLETENEEAAPINLDFSARRLGEHELRRFLQNVGPEYLRLVPYSGEQPNYVGEFKQHGSEVQELTLVSLSHFLPSRLIHKFKEKDQRKKHLEISLSRLVMNLLINEDDSIFSSMLQQYSELINPSIQVSEEMKESIKLLSQKYVFLNDFSGQTIMDLLVWFRNIIKTQFHNTGKTPKTRRTLRVMRLQREMQKKITQEILNKELEGFEDVEGLETVVSDSFLGDPFADSSIAEDSTNIFYYVDFLDETVMQITKFFTTKIRYLGPLRADPQASQKFAPSSELDDVGAKGEYAAAVYDANQNASINWYNPLSKKVEKGTLKSALDTWSYYLGVADQIKIETAGQSGFSWQVIHKMGQRPLPLSAVGVGVSQVLPILVMGLLAPNDTLLIVEQPELHLHPSVQSRLGDFFVGLAKCNKQCLIETHSENLVSQLRYHIVEAGGMDKSDCMIYFVDQDEKGASTFNPVEISPQGNILNWPDGFFDETMRQEDRITAASLRKRAQKVKHG